MCFFLCSTEAAWVTRVLPVGGCVCVCVVGGGAPDKLRLASCSSKTGRMTVLFLFCHSSLSNGTFFFFYLQTNVGSCSCVLGLMWTQQTLFQLLRYLQVKVSPRRPVHFTFKTCPRIPSWDKAWGFRQLFHHELIFILNKEQLLREQVNAALPGLNSAKVKAKTFVSRHVWATRDNFIEHNHTLLINKLEF